MKVKRVSISAKVFGLWPLYCCEIIANVCYMEVMADVNSSHFFCIARSGMQISREMIGVLSYSNCKRNVINFCVHFSFW